MGRFATRAARSSSTDGRSGDNPLIHVIWGTKAEAIKVAPVLREIAALPEAVHGREPLAHALESIAGKRQYLRGARGDGGVATVSGPGSHLVAALAAAELLIVVPEHVTHLEPGEIVETVEL